MKKIYSIILLSFLSQFSSFAQTGLWVNSLGSTTNDEGRTIKVAPNGNVCVAGKFTGTMDLDPGPGVYNVTSNGLDDIYLACYNSSGGFLWGFGIGGNRYDAAWYMTIDASNNVIISGYFQTAGIDFDPGGGTTTLPFAGGTTLTYYGDGFVAKYSAAGTFQWAKALGGPTVYDIALSLDTDPAGNVYVGGVFNTSMVVSPTITLTSATDGTAYLIKYDAAGTVIWGHNYGLPGISSVDCFPRSLKVSGGFIYVAGFFQGLSNFCPWGTPIFLTSSGTYDLYVAKYDVDANLIFAKKISGTGGTDIDEFMSLSLDASDNIYVLGETSSATIVFDPATPLTTTVSTPGGGGNTDIIMAKYDNAGNYLWGKVMGSTGHDIGYCIDVAGGYIYCTGQFSGTVDFAPAAAGGNMTSAGSNDIFVTKYDLGGNYQCSFKVGATGDDGGFGIHHDPAGYIYATGQYIGTSVDFDPSASSIPLTTTGVIDGYFGKYDPACLGTFCNTLTLPDTIKLCIGDTMTIPAVMGGTDSVLSYAWSPAIGLSSTTILTPVVTAATSGYYFLTLRSLNESNLVMNGDFSGGNSGFSSSYTYSPPPSSVLLEGRYSVYTNPFGVHTGFTTMGDHTTGTGNMMIINGGPSPVDVWCQTISVTPNTDYNFSAWFANCSSVTTGPDVPVLQFRINGILQGTPTTVTAAPGTWMNFATTWNSGPSTTASICIYDALTTASGNDFAIDDILFQRICSTTDSVYVLVNNFDTTTSVTNDTVCAATLPINLSAPSGHTTYLWSTGSTSPTTISAATAGTYWVTAQSNCSIVSDTFKVSTYPSPIVNLGNDTGFCIGNTYVLSTTQPAGSTLIWSTGSTGDTIEVSSSGHYVLTVTNSDGCVGKDSVDIVVGPPPIVDLGPDTVNCTGAPILLMSSVMYTTPVYLWHNASVGPTFTATATGTYWLQVSENGCSGADTIHVEIKYDTFTLYNPDTAICKGQSVQVYATGHPDIVFHWVPTTGIATPYIINPMITTDTSATYYLIAHLEGCSDGIDSFHIDVQPNPDPFLGTTRHVCQYDSLKIHSYVDPPWYTHYSYSWSPATQIDFPTLPSVVFKGDTTISLVLTVTTPAGCSGKDSVMIVAHPGDFAGITADTSLCPNDSVQLVATGGVGYKWSPAMYLDNPNAARPWAKPITTQVYSVIATNSDGCRDTLSMLLKVHPAAVVHLEDSVTIFSGESYQINPQTNGTKFSWTPSGGLSGKYIANPLATPEVSTKYILMATTEEGCIAKDSITITLNDNALVEVPNAFTPGSGANNKIFPMRRGLVSLKSFRIFNRWGNLVYESADIDAGWDGTYKGAAQPMGVYVYTIEAVTDKGKLITKSGNITLLR